MTHELTPSQPQTVLAYQSQASSVKFSRAIIILLVWQILSACAAPVTAVIGGGGMLLIMSRGGNGFWNQRSLEDWIGVLLWSINAVGFLAVPSLWTLLCGRYRKLLANGDTNGALLAERLCHRTKFVVAILVVGMLFGIFKAVHHGRWQELLWWIGLLLAVALFTAAAEYSRRVFLKIATNFPPPESPPSPPIPIPPYSLRPISPRRKL